MSTGVSSLLKNLQGQLTNNSQANNTNYDSSRGTQVIYQAPWGPVTRSNAESQTVNHGPWGASKVESAAQTVYHAPWGPVTSSESENQSSFLAPWGVVTRKPEQESAQTVHLTPWGPISTANNNSEGSPATSSVVLPGGPPPRSVNADLNRRVDVSTMFMRSQGDFNSRWRPDAGEVPAPPLQDSQNIPQCTTYSVRGTNIVQESCLKGEPIVPPSSEASGSTAAIGTRTYSVPIPPAVLICASLD